MKYHILAILALSTISAFASSVTGIGSEKIEFKDMEINTEYPSPMPMSPSQANESTIYVEPGNFDQLDCVIEKTEDNLRLADPKVTSKILRVYLVKNLPDNTKEVTVTGKYKASVIEPFPNAESWGGTAKFSMSVFSPTESKGLYGVNLVADGEWHDLSVRVKIPEGFDKDSGVFLAPGLYQASGELELSPLTVVAE